MSKASELQQEGVKLFEQHDYEAAARSFRQALEAYEAAAQPEMAAEMKVNIGLVHRALGENQQALDLMQEALRAFQSSGDALRTAQVLGNLGGVYAALNDKGMAYQSYRQAADTFLSLNENVLYGRTLLALGALQVRDGKLMEGAASYQTGLSQLDDLTFTQKIIKRLSSIITSLGGGAR